jgi:hypothetical protein
MYRSDTALARLEGAALSSSSDIPGLKVLRKLRTANVLTFFSVAAEALS